MALIASAFPFALLTTAIHRHAYIRPWSLQNTRLSAVILMKWYSKWRIANNVIPAPWVRLPHLTLPWSSHAFITFFLPLLLSADSDFHWKPPTLHTSSLKGLHAVVPPVPLGVDTWARPSSQDIRSPQSEGWYHKCSSLLPWSPKIFSWFRPEWSRKGRLFYLHTCACEIVNLELKGANFPRGNIKSEDIKDG